MKRIVTLALMMLIGGYGVARAQTPLEVEQATEIEAATKDFLGLKWGLGIGVMGGIGGGTAVEKASLTGDEKLVRVDEEGDMRPQMFLEMHAFLWGGGGDRGNGKVKKWRDYQQEKAKYQMTNAAGIVASPPDMKNYKVPLWGVGPFVALQGSEKDVINALAVGLMWGIRKDPNAANSVNVGVGVSFDPSVQVLGHGVKEGRALPPGESEVRFKKEGQFGWVLMTSFTF